MSELSDLRAYVKRLELEIQELSIDAVTGIAGRRVLDREMAQQFARGKRFGRSVGLLMIDIDNFKRFNDDHGHAAGDRVLNAVAQCVAAQVRVSDTVGRYGGEEIAICVDEARDVKAFAERLRAAVADLQVEDLPRVTVSIGCAVSDPEDTGADDALKRADAALYTAKERGRNRVAI